MKSFFRNNPALTGQEGQVGVIILLIMAAMLTIGLSLATRTTEEVFISNQQTESTRVFNAAEAGIEEALSSDLTTSEGGSVSGFENIDVDYSVSRVNELDTLLFEGVSVAVDVTGATDGQQLRVDWSEENDCSTEDPSRLILNIYSEVAGETKVRYIPLSACANEDGFEVASTINENGLRRRYDVTLQTGDFLVRVKSLYNDTKVNISGNGFTLPVQYFAVRSQAESTTGNETRVVEVNRTLSAAPSVMDYALFSGDTIIK